MLLPPGPEQSSLMMTLRRGWAGQRTADVRSSVRKRDFVVSIFIVVGAYPSGLKPNIYQDVKRHG